MQIMLLLLQQIPNLPLVSQLHTYFKILIIQMKPHFSVTQAKQTATPQQQKGSSGAKGTPLCGLSSQRRIPQHNPWSSREGTAPGHLRRAPPGGAVGAPARIHKT